MDTLGAVAHPGGLVVRRPELTVGVVLAVSRLSGLEIELLARHSGDGPGTPAPRRLLPAYDEGIDLRAGLLDHTGRVRWEFAISCSSDSNGDGEHHRPVFRFPPVFDEMSLVLAWPEIGFPETVLRLPLPDRQTVSLATTSIWQAPPDVRAVPEGLTHRADEDRDPPAVETGTNLTPPRVLHSRDHEVAVVLTRLTAVDSLLSLELLSAARGGTADAVNARAFTPRRRSFGGLGDVARIRARAQGASVAAVSGHEAVWLRPGDGSASGGDQSFSCLQEFTLQRPSRDVLDLVVGWPLAGLDDVRISLSLT
ncbi:hypothetical protein [Lentzea sp.]|uniref:hypothetical protein n=1 Tax=Lentzea sp. TaxID=56099 RepID=UPI002ED18624